MKAFELDPNINPIIAEIPAEVVPDDIHFEAIATLNEVNGLPHWGEHEDAIKFGLIHIDAENDYIIGICAMLDNFKSVFVPL